MKIVVLLIIILTIPLFAKVNRMTILDFDNNSGIKKYNSLGKGLADMLTTDLTYVKGLKIVEREKLRVIMKEMNLSKSKYISKKSMLKLGKGLSANWILKGSFTTMKGKMRIDVNIIDVQTGEVVESATVEGWVQKFFDLERRLIRKIIKSIHTKEIRLTYKPENDKREVKDFKAVINYSRGVKLYDEGNFKESEKAFKKALTFDNNFDYSDKYLKALEERLKKYKEADILRKKYENNKKVKKFLDNFEELKKGYMFYSDAVTVIALFMSNGKYKEGLKLINYIKKNVSENELQGNSYNLLINFLDYSELFFLHFIRRNYRVDKKKNKKLLIEIEKEILKKGEVFINVHPKSSQKGTVIGYMEAIINDRKGDVKKEKEKEAKLIKNTKEYKKYKKNKLKKYRKDMKSKTLKNTLRYRKNDVERELKRREREIKREKKNGLSKKELQKSKDYHIKKLKYCEDRVAKYEKELLEKPLKLKKRLKMDLLNRAVTLWQYKEAKQISDELLKMKNLTDYDRLRAYKYTIDNYINEGNNKEALSFYNSIKKYLNLKKYENKYIKSKEYLNKVKKLKKGKYDEKIEALDDKIEDEEDNKVKKALRSERQELNNVKKDLEKYIETQEKDYSNIKRYVEYIERDIKRIPK